MARKKRRKKSTSRYKATGPVGKGTRFKKLVAALKKRGAKNPKALAAWIGRKKYGKKRFQKMSAKGRSRRAKRRKK